MTLPAQLFTELLPLLGDEAELRVTLYALYAIHRRRGPLRAVRASELASEGPLVRTLARCGGADAIAPALARAAARGALLGCTLTDGDALYLAPTDAGRRALVRLRAGALAAPGVQVVRTVRAEPPTSAVAAYEQEIGPLGPAVADGIAQAEERYPEAWIVEAVRLAATRNARSWRYIEAVLARWEAEGRDDATAGGAAARASGDRAYDHGPYERAIKRS